jgi:Pyruvate/2-oxoacid:ferredoxin oxidoreductase delta subunit
MCRAQPALIGFDQTIACKQCLFFAPNVASSSACEAALTGFTLDVCK